MTPKQKCDELVNKYRIILQDTDTEVGEEILCTLVSKTCAKIAVDEITSYSKEWYEYDYWFKVKTEINKL